MPRVKYWEIIADNLSKAGWSWGCALSARRKGWPRLLTSNQRSATSPDPHEFHPVSRCGINR
jgi:hypothetical protein